MRASGKYQETLDTITPELIAAKVIDPTLLEKRYRQAGGGAEWKSSSTPPTALPLPPGLVHAPQPPGKPKLHGVAPPPGWEPGKKGVQAKPGEIDLYPFAFAHGIPELVSKITHETKHLSQYQSGVIPGKSKIPGTVTGQGSAKSLIGMQEVQAHHAEIMNSAGTGLATDKKKMKEIWGWLDHYWGQVHSSDKPRIQHLYDEAQAHIKSLFP